MAKTQNTPSKSRSKKADKPKRPTIRQIQEYLALKARRLELQGIADAVKRREDQMRADFFAYVKSLSSNKYSVGKFVLWLKGRKSVAWKNEFIRVAGEDAAAEVAANAKESYGLEVSET